MKAIILFFLVSLCTICIPNHIFLGDSIASGSNASAGNSYRELMTTNQALTATNLTASGRGVWFEVKNISTANFKKCWAIIWEEAGLNDVRRDSSQQVFNKIESCVSTVVKKAFLKTAVFAGSSNCTRTGTWNNPGDITGYACEGKSTISGLPQVDAAATASQANAAISWTFSGDNVWVSFLATYPGIVRGQCEISIDGAAVDTVADLNGRYDGISDGSYDNKRGPHIKFYSSLSDTTHTILLRSLNSTIVVIDQFGVLESPDNCAQVRLIQIPYIVNYSLAGLNKANANIIDRANAIKDSVVTGFKNLGYPIEYCPIMDGTGGQYSLTNCDTDGVHPKTVGHAQIYQSLLPYIN